MAYLTKCSICNRNVSSDCKSCPSCGHNVFLELHQKEYERGNNLLKQDICPKCNNKNWRRYLFSSPEKWERSVGLEDVYSRECAQCGWKDFYYREYSHGSIQRGHYSPGE